MPKRTAKRIQINIHMQRPRGMTITNKLLNAAIQHFIKTGKMPSGMTLTGVIWENDPVGTTSYDGDDLVKLREVLTAAQNIGLLGGEADFRLSDSE